MGGRDVIAHIKDALASAHPGAVDDEVTEYVADMANELLAEGDLGRSPAEMAEELVDAAGPMLAEFIDDDAIKSLFDDAVAHHLGGGGSAAGDGSSADGGAPTSSSPKAIWAGPPPRWLRSSSMRRGPCWRSSSTTMRSSHCSTTRWLTTSGEADRQPGTDRRRTGAPNRRRSDTASTSTGSYSRSRARSCSGPRR